MLTEVRILKARLAFTVSFTALMLFSSPAHAEPTLGNVEAGVAEVTNPALHVTQVTQSSDKAVLNWQNFDVGADERVEFRLPSASSVTLNRDMSGDVSEVFGSISSNGQFFLINPNGILFGPGSRVDVAALVASTHDINTDAFMRGDYTFDREGLADASVTNAGSVTVADLGFAAFVAPHVRNDGMISARLGRVELSSARGFALDLYGDGLISFLMPGSTATTVSEGSVTNTGSIIADGGRIALTAQSARAAIDNVINVDGLVQANTVEKRGGKIVLGGGETQRVVVSGKVDAKGNDNSEVGGEVFVLGRTLTAEQASSFEASGHSGGGKILFGGDFQGGKTDLLSLGNRQFRLEVTPVFAASTVTVEEGASFSADSLLRGDGGQIVVWSEEATSFDGHISAKGGSQAGDGGLAEVSGKKALSFAGSVDLSSATGQRGTLLLDPENVAIGGVGATMSASTLLTALASSDVVISNGPGAGLGDITVAAPLIWSSASKLTLNAQNNIYIDAPITALSGGLELSTSGGIFSLGAVNVDDFRLQNGHWQQNTPNLPTFSANSFNILDLGLSTSVSFLRTAGGSGSTLDPFLVSDVYGLQGIASRNYLTSAFSMNQNIDARGTADWNSGLGFVPIGWLFGFQGVFDGRENLIDELHSTDSWGGVSGLFGAIGNSGLVRRVGFTAAEISCANRVSGVFCGVVAGTNAGSIDQVFAQGTVSTYGQSVFNGGYGSGYGGLVGFNGSFLSGPGGSITNSFASVAVSGGTSAFNFGQNAGLVGANTGLIASSYAIGVSGPGGTGLNGNSLGTVINSYWDTQATGNATSGGGTGLTTVELTSGLQTGFNSNVWSIVPGYSYPYLTWQNPATIPYVLGPPPPPPPPPPLPPPIDTSMPELDRAIVQGQGLAASDKAGPAEGGIGAVTATTPKTLATIDAWLTIFESGQDIWSIYGEVKTIYSTLRSLVDLRDIAEIVEIAKAFGLSDAELVKLRSSIDFTTPRLYVTLLDQLGSLAIEKHWPDDGLVSKPVAKLWFKMMVSAAEGAATGSPDSAAVGAVVTAVSIVVDEYATLTKENNALVKLMLDGAKANVAVLEQNPSRSSLLSGTLDLTSRMSAELSRASPWQVDTAWKMNIIGELLRVKASQIAPSTYGASMASARQVATDYDSIGVFKGSTYRKFADEVAKELGIVGWISAYPFPLEPVIDGVAGSTPMFN